MNKWVQAAVLVLVLLVAGALRLSGVDWDDYHHYHPDERYITWVATTIEWPADWRTALDPMQSTFNPFYWPPGASSEGIVVEEDQARSFAYGHLPLYLGVAVTRLVERVGPLLRPYLPADWLLTRDILNGARHIEFRHLTAVTRAFTAVVDMGTIVLLFLLGRRLYGGAIALLAAAFLALNVMHIQLAHFFTFDPYMTFFVVAALYFMVLSLGDGTATVSNTSQAGGKAGLRSACFLLAAVCVGLAVGSKFSAVLLLAPLALTAWFGMGRQWERWLVAAVLLAALTFFLTNPFALLDLSCEVVSPALRLGPVTIPALNWRSCYLDDILTQSAMVRRQSDLAFTRQYIGTMPYLYPLEMQLRWGMGPFLGVVALAGLAWTIGRLLYHSRRAAGNQGKAESAHPPLAAPFSAGYRSELILLAWVIPFFLITGSFDVKFMRYLQPLAPFFILFGAAWLGRWRRALWRRLVVVAVLIGTGLYAAAFVNMYGQPHPWITASHWIYLHLPRASRILTEQWDDPLPTTMVVAGEVRRRGEYLLDELTWLNQPDDRDDEVKLADNLALLAQADYVVLASNRVYGVVPTLPTRYPLSSQYYPLLFDGSLGYQAVFVTGRFPHLFNFYLKPDTFSRPKLQPPTLVSSYLESLPGWNGGFADESFTVYDQPLTIIFENRGRLTAAEMMEHFRTD